LFESFISGMWRPQIMDSVFTNFTLENVKFVTIFVFAFCVQYNFVYPTIVGPDDYTRLYLCSDIAIDHFNVFLI